MIGDFIESFVEKLKGSSGILTYELMPPKSSDFRSVLKSAKDSSISEFVDAFVLPDSPLAKLKHSALLAAIKTQKFLEKPAITTLAMRDRNSIAIQADMLGANELDARLFLALTGDKIANGDQPQAKGVFEGNSNYALALIERLNAHTDANGAVLKDAALRKIYGFCAINAYANNMEHIKNKIFGKVAAGAAALFTQPIYDLKTAENLQSLLDGANKILGANAVLVFGFFPILSYKNALFLLKKLPGVFVPESYIEALKNCNGDTAKERSVGMELSISLFSTLRQNGLNIHFMNHGKLQTALEILRHCEP